MEEAGTLTITTTPTSIMGAGAVGVEVAEDGVVGDGSRTAINKRLPTPPNYAS